jgi:hypothetical protein
MYQKVPFLLQIILRYKCIYKLIGLNYTCVHSLNMYYTMLIHLFLQLLHYAEFIIRHLLTTFVS